MSVSPKILDSIIGDSPPMRKLKTVLLRAAPTDLPVLLKGETGTGKTHIARIIHEASGRKGPFVSVNLAVIPAGLASAELFGFRRGAFTGADADKPGLISSADGGTLFLDELEVASPEVQALLVCFLSGMSIVAVGDTRERKVDVRVIASVIRMDNRSSTLRRDLLDRLAGIVIEIPPLRARREDISALAASFLGRRAGVQLSDEAAALLQKHPYPGNVRELYSVLARAAALAEGDVIKPSELEFFIYDDEPKEKVSGDSIRRELATARAELESLQRSSIPATPIWEGRRFDTEADYCFVLMPFADLKDMQRVYGDHIKPVVERRCNLRCERADDIHDISGVMQSVWESINRARIIIAEMTERNPNVFYELGIAHTLGKPVIMVTQSMEFVPFDLKHLRCIVYDYKPGAISKFEDALEKTVRRVLASTFAVPVAKLRQE